MKTFTITYKNSNSVIMIEEVNARNEKSALKKFDMYLYHINGEFISIA